MEFYRELVTDHPWIATLLGLLALALVAGFVNFVVKVVLVRLLNRIIGGIAALQGPEVVRSGVIARLANAFPAMVISSGIMLVPGLPEAVALVVRNVATAVIILVIAMAISAALNLFDTIWHRRPTMAGRSAKGYIQIVKIAVFGIAAILMIAAIIDRSPLILLSGLGALTAVLILVFQDTLLSLVASVQISSTDIVKVGDWIEMPALNADGDVIEIALHTVKVQNWDRTVTTIPTRRLVSDPVKNWRGMFESGGRRIKRSLYLDQTSIRFLTEEERDRLARFAPLERYMEEKAQELQAWNAELGPRAEVAANRRQMTNIGTFRAYVNNYLRNHPGVHQGMILMVRQLAPTPDGLPLELYCFTSTTAWVGYEGTQADIFDHLYAVLPEFGLRVFQNPSGGDFAVLGGPRGD
ncbi:MAG: mechanosensitive ion channel family protein [Gemmobacter sp.]